MASYVNNNNLPLIPNQNTPRSLRKLVGQDVVAKYTFNGTERVYNAAESTLFGQVIIGRKKFGCEPGFTAKKEWTDRDHAKLCDPTHKFHQEASEYLRKNGYQQVDFANRDSEIYKEVVEYLTDNLLKFKKEHYWKLHYAEPILGHVMIDSAQQNDPFHRLGTYGTRRDKNIGALLETLANDIFNILKCESQKVSLRLSRYQDGYPMFLIDSTQVTGPDGEAFIDLAKANAILEAPKFQGRIEGNLVPDPKNKERKVPLDEEKLGSALLKALLLGDRDKVGKRGGNLGYVVVDKVGKAILKNIDPGKSFESGACWRADRMDAKDDIHTDCSYYPEIGPQDYLTGGYINFTIFNDTTLADRMQGMKDIHANWAAVKERFQEYIQFLKSNENTLDPNRPANEPSMYQVVEQQLARLEKRYEMFLRILEKRIDLSKSELNWLDCLEKLTSPTTKRAPVKGREIDLKYLRFVDPLRKRTEWTIEKEGNATYYTFEAKDHSQFNEVIDTLFKFMLFVDGKCNPFFTFTYTTTVSERGIKCKVRFHDKNIEKFTHEKIVAYKNRKSPIVLSPDRALQFLSNFIQFIGTPQNAYFNAQLVEKTKTFLTYAQLPIGSVAGTVHPAFAALALAGGIASIVRSCSGQQALPFSQEVLFEAINTCLLPLADNIKQVCEQNKALTEAQTSTLLGAMQLSQDRLAGLLNTHRKETKEGFEDQAFNGFVSRAQGRVGEYRAKARGGRSAKFLQLSEDALTDAKGFAMHGFNGPAPTYALAEARKNAIYCTGNIHHSLHGTTKLPAELNLLDLVCYTLTHHVQQPGINRDGVKQLAETALGCVQEQLALFGKVNGCLENLQKSHQALMKELQRNIEVTEEKRQATNSRAVQSWMAENEKRVLEEVVGRKMFGWNILVHSPLNLCPYEDEMRKTITFREVCNLPIATLNFIHNEIHQWNILAQEANQKIVAASSLVGLLQLETIEKTKKIRGYIRPQLVRRIWWDNVRYHSDLSVTAPSYFPLHHGLINIHTDPTSSNSPQVDCAVTYNERDNTFITKFASTSRLQEKDVRGIPKVGNEEGSKRLEVIKERLLRIKNLAEYGERNIKKYSETPGIDLTHPELCLSLDGSTIPLVLPWKFMHKMRHSLCPEFEKLALSGKQVELKYSFEKNEKDQSYQFYLHAVYEGLPYCSKCACEFDSVTVESYADQLSHHAPNLNEFLLCAMFFTGTSDVGFPGRGTYVNPENRIIAPQSIQFPGLEFLLQIVPDKCFSYDHKQFSTEEFAHSFLKYTYKPNYNYGNLDKFLKNTEIRFHDNYLVVKAKIQDQIARLEESAVYVEYKKRYDQFMAMAKLVSDLDESKIERLLQDVAQIIPPGKMGCLEQAPLYKAPVEGWQDRILGQFTPSVAKTNLEKYKEQLGAMVLQFSNPLDDDLFLKGLAIVNGPFDPEYNLEKATY